MQKRVRQAPQRYSEITEYGTLNALKEKIKHAQCYVFCIQPNFAIVTDFYVDDDQRKKGFGKLLVETLKQKFPNTTFFASSEEPAEIFWSKVANPIPFQEIPTIVKCHIDRWGHKKYKQFSFAQESSDRHRIQT